MDNQNTAIRAYRDFFGKVLILVLMDNQNTSYFMEEELKTIVLILVLMDNQNTKLRHMKSSNIILS